MNFQERVERDSIITPGQSSALGAAVSLKGTGYFLGTVIEVGEGRKGVWVRRFQDSADVMVHYSVAELELAAVDDLAAVAHWFLSGQYIETCELRKAVAS